MPKRSNKDALIDFLIEDCMEKIVTCDDSDDEGDVIDECFENLSVVMMCRYSVPFKMGSVVKSIEWFNNVLPSHDDGRFKQFLRVTREQFCFILRKIEGDVVFTREHSSKQLSIDLQLAIFLYRLGCYGDGGTIAKIASLFGCGDGGTISKICRRVIQAILRQKENYLYWPREAERIDLANSTFDELPHCIGYLDGSEVPLAEKPLRDWECYYSRKQRYSIKFQIVCDYKLRVRHLVAGAPGSVHDSRIFLNSSLWLQKGRFFSGMQWLAADSAYRPSSIVVCPFKQPSGRLLDERKRKFNQIFSSYRVRVEHCLGVIKERFSSLKELRTQIDGVESIKHSCQWITVACILHNMLIQFSGDGDFAALLKDVVAEELTGDQVVCEEEDNSAGTIKRNALMAIIL